MELIFIGFVLAAFVGGFYMSKVLHRVERMETMLSSLSKALEDVKPLLAQQEAVDKALEELNKAKRKPQRSWNPGNMRLSPIPDPISPKDQKDYMRPVDIDEEFAE